MVLESCELVAVDHMINPQCGTAIKKPDGSGVPSTAASQFRF